MEYWGRSSIRGGWREQEMWKWRQGTVDALSVVQILGSLDLSAASNTIDSSLLLKSITFANDWEKRNGPVARVAWTVKERLFKTRRQ